MRSGILGVSILLPVRCWRLKGHVFDFRESSSIGLDLINGTLEGLNNALNPVPESFLTQAFNVLVIRTLKPILCRQLSNPRTQHHSYSSTKISFVAHRKR
jgi:hypothetical protein